MKLYYFSGPNYDFFVPSLKDGERILSALVLMFGDVDREDYTAMEVEVDLK